MNMIYSYIIFSVVLIVNTLPGNAMDGKETNHLFRSNNGGFVEWIAAERRSDNLFPLPLEETNQDYRNHPDFQYFKSKYEEYFNSGKPFHEIQFQIGSCYYSGTGVGPNFSHAAWWYYRSATHKNESALAMLNVLAKNDKNEDAILYLNLLQSQIQLGSSNWESL